MDFTGRHVRRITVSRLWIEVAAGAAAFFALLLLTAFVHGLWISDQAHESIQIRHENQELARVLVQLETQLPKLRELSSHTDMTFSDLWAKSGLGVDSKLLADKPANEKGVDDAADDAPEESPTVMAASPLSLPLEIERIESDGDEIELSLAETLEYFHDAERLLLNTPSIRPARTPWLTSSFGVRFHPIMHIYIMHKGLDMAGHIGMPIYAPADGAVIWAGKRGGYGNTVVLDHGYGMQTHFAHLSKYMVQRGAHVRRGDVIALMGNTGHSTGPHLHYEVRRNGQPMDPRRFILD
jgi:murein DD-endopeptidase MepM/ murein hydrolase activator NlpD